MSRLSHLVALEPPTDKRKQVFGNPDKRRWQLHRTNAKQRGIEFKLTFEEWFCWWMDTGRYMERGRDRQISDLGARILIGGDQRKGARSPAAEAGAAARLADPHLHETDGCRGRSLRRKRQHRRRGTRGWQAFSRMGQVRALRQRYIPRYQSGISEMSTFSIKKWGAILDAIEWFRAFCRKSDEAAIRRLPEIEQDARRYRWLRSNNDPGPSVVRTVMLDQTTEPVESRMCFGDDLDAQIDAEMVGHATT